MEHTSKLPKRRNIRLKNPSIDSAGTYSSKFSEPPLLSSKKHQGSTDKVSPGNRFEKSPVFITGTAHTPQSYAT